MSNRRLDTIDKNRFAAQDRLREDRSSSALRSAAHRAPGKKFNHPDVKRGASLGKQTRPLNKDPYVARKPDTLLDDLSEIREKGRSLKQNKPRSKS